MQDMRGKIVRDTITGFEGVVTCHTSYLTNVDVVVVQPRGLGKEGKPLESQSFDLPQVDVYTEIGEKIRVHPLEETGIQLGDTVADTLSEFNGRAVAKSRWLNGCVRFGVQPPKLRDGKIGGYEWLPASQLKVTKAAKAPGKKPLGGPAQKPRDVQTPG